MSLRATRATVGTSAARLDTPEPETRWSISICNRGTASVFLGPSDVSTTSGFELAVGERASFLLRPSDGGIYAVSGSTGQRVDRIQVGWS